MNTRTTATALAEVCMSRSHYLKWLLAAMVLISCGGASAAKKPLKVYIMAGQSNMQGHSMKSTLSYMAADPKTKALYDKIMDTNGAPRVYDQVRVAAFSESSTWGRSMPRQVEKIGPLAIGFGGSLNDPDKFGPELGFGIAMYEELDQPILIIKTSWGGKSVLEDFRSPSSIKPDPKRDAEEAGKLDDWMKTKGADTATQWGISAQELRKWRETARGRYYRYMVEHVKQVLADPGNYHPAYDKNAGCEIAGFVWFQGFNDMVSGREYDKQYGGYAVYGDFLACLIRDARKDLSAPNMPVVIGVVGFGGKLEDMKDEKGRERSRSFREAQAMPASLPEFKGRVVTVHTAEYYPVEVAAAAEKAFTISHQVDKEAKERKKNEPNVSAKELAAWSKKRVDAMLQEQLTAKERLALEGKSNQGYHYYGCGKFFGQIGEAFADAMPGTR